MSGEENKVVCVTGGSGFIASWLVKLLLQRGYTVKATVRDPNDSRKVEHLHSLDGAKDRLQLFPANLVEDGSFDTAFEGCIAVFHTASPFNMNPKDPQVELIDPAVKGTLNVLKSCAKVPSIKRVVLTSSLAAVVCNASKPLSPDVVVDESWFSDPNFCKNVQLWYEMSKTLAEEAAWKFAKETGIDLVTMNPGMVIGPFLQPTLNTSVGAIASLFSGSEFYPNMSFGFVNVKDVATAHILALEVPSAHGRYCLVDTVAHFSEIVKILRESFPNAKLPQKCAEDDNPLKVKYQVSQEKAQSLGVDFIPLQTTVVETVESLKDKGFVHF